MYVHPDDILVFMGLPSAVCDCLQQAKMEWE